MQQRIKIDMYCQRQRCNTSNWSSFWHAFTSCELVSDSWTYSLIICNDCRVPMLIANLSLSPLTVSGEQKPFQHLSLSKVLCSYIVSDYSNCLVNL